MSPEMTPGYSALTHGAGLVDLSARGRIRVTGEDRARLLHAMCTNHVNAMKPGDSIYAFFLNAQGRIQSDAYVLCQEDEFLLDTEPETAKSLFEHLDKFIIADDAALEDISEATACLGISGPRAVEVVNATALPLPCARFDLSVGLSDASVRLYAPVEHRDELTQALEAAGAIAASTADAELDRIRRFRPRYGVDITESTLPQETQQMHALHFQKGCYLGQEIVERIRSRGHVNKLLMGFRLEGHSVPTPGSALIGGGKEVGEVTSAAEIAGEGVFGLAYVRVPYNKPGAIAGIDGRPAELF